MQPQAPSWNKERLCSFIKQKLGNRRLIVVSNREPYEHYYSGGDVVWKRPVGGLTEALDPVLRAAGGCWVAHGSGNADRDSVDNLDCVAVPPDSNEYTLRRIWLDNEEIEGYYLGFANEALWPLCHIAFVPPVFNEEHWQIYRSVNRKFADAVLEEIGEHQSVIVIQDYHLALAARMLRAERPDLTIGQFWHIPWPPYDVFRTCPWREEIVEGLLGNDLLGFHTRHFCDNFINAARQLTGTMDRTEIAAFPISVDFEQISSDAARPEVETEMVRLEKELDLGGRTIGVGMDRLDYTKGIPERLLAYERFLRDNPEYRGKTVFIQAGMPSREKIDAYQRLGNHIEAILNSINDEFGTGHWQPVIAIPGQLSNVTLNALRRLADFCVVSSLDDGMNLVVKEYAAARNDEDGVLLLSEFTGAAAELKDALIINPYDTAGFAGTIKSAIEMSEEERRRRMAGLRMAVRENNIYHWAAELLSRLIGIMERER